MVTFLIGCRGYPRVSGMVINPIVRVIYHPRYKEFRPWLKWSLKSGDIRLFSGVFFPNQDFFGFWGENIEKSSMGLEYFTYMKI